MTHDVETGVVFRFGARTPEDLFFAEKRQPLVTDFEIGSDEAREAAQTGMAFLSVWDETLTSVDQARQFISTQRRLAIWLPVDAIRKLPYELRVARDPHPKDLPGREGHCNLGNVWSSDKIIRKKIRADLRDIATADRHQLPSPPAG